MTKWTIPVDHLVSGSVPAADIQFTSSRVSLGNGSVVFNAQEMAFLRELLREEMVLKDIDVWYPAGTYGLSKEERDQFLNKLKGDAS